MAFQIVLGAEQALTAGLALAPRDRAQSVETPGDGGEEALLGLHVGRDRAEERGLRLVGAIGPAETLNGRVGLPTRLQQIVDAQPTVSGGHFGVVAAAGPARVGEDEDSLHVVHEGGGFGKIGRSGATLDDEPVAFAHDTTRTAGDLGDDVRAEALDDLVECARNRRQRCEMLNQAVAASDGFAALDGLAVAIDRA